MSDILTIDQFQPHEGETFLVQTGVEGIEPVPMQLVSVSSLRLDTSAGNREPFSLLFVQPAGVHLPQRIYRFEHPALDACELFIVPLGPDPRGMQYEAIFT
jgi:hypothetical protein